MSSVTFTIHNDDVVNRDRTCVNLLTPAEQDAFLEDGLVIPRTRIDEEGIEILRDAVNALAAARFSTAEEKTYETEFAGQYIRDPHKRDPRILTVPLLRHAFADTVRCLLGPRILLRNSNIRITQPRTGDSTVWHTDYRPYFSPSPPLVSAPTVITLLVYLDAADRETGPLSYKAGSHLLAAQPPESDADPDDVSVVEPCPGEVVFMNAALWHKGGPNRSSDRTRRLITLQLSSVFMAPFNFGTTLPSADYQRLVAQARSQRDEPLLELLGLGGLHPNSTRY